MIRQNHKLGILRKHLDKWMESKSISTGTVAIEIVQAVERLEMEEELKTVDIHFKTDGDAYHATNTNRQKIFRWLGYLDNGDHASSAKIFYFERAIIAAMPEAIRTGYLNESLAGTGVCFAIAEDGESANMERIAQSLIKEGSEAQLAILSLKDNPEAIQHAVTEIKESLAAHQAALNTLNNMAKPLRSVEVG